MHLLNKIQVYIQVKSLNVMVSIDIIHHKLLMKVFFPKDTIPVSLTISKKKK